MGADADVESLYLTLLASWNARDAAGFAELFTPDGSMVGFDGSCVETQAAIVEHLRSIFDDHEPATYVATVRDIRQLCRGCMLLRGVAGMVPPGASDIKPELNTVHLLVAVEVDGHPRVAHFQSTPAAFHGRPEEAAALTAELRTLLPSTRRST